MTPEEVRAEAEALRRDPPYGDEELSMTEAIRLVHLREALKHHAAS